MMLISHRGNINGKKPELENQPQYILKGVLEGYFVEVDICQEVCPWNIKFSDDSELKLNLSIFSITLLFEIF